MRLRAGQYLTHGPRRPLLKPWRRECRCGLGAWPCHALTMLQVQAKGRAAVPQRPPWQNSTVNMLSAALMTRGQAARTRQGGQ